MGSNWHCIPSGCAEVVYREYLSSTIRWRYPGEDWRQIVGADNYTTAIIKKYCLGVRYRLFFSTAVIRNGVLDGWASFNRAIDISVLAEAPFSNIRLVVQGMGAYSYAGEPVFHWAYNQNGISPDGSLARVYEVVLNTTARQNVVIYRASPSGMRIDDIRPMQDDSSCPPDCLFKVIKQGSVVHQETREDCPEVEVLPCQLDKKTKSIKFNKLPYLERVEVRNQSIETIFVGSTDLPLIKVDSLPDECLNVYKSYTLAPPVLSDFVPLPGVINFYEFIGQICSSPGCPRPEYEVICGCECEECPEGTCPIECRGVICCYDSSGKSVKQIELKNYCGGSP